MRLPRGIKGIKFLYGNSECKFSVNKLYVDYCDSVHDLTQYEDYLKDDYATYLVKRVVRVKPKIGEKKGYDKVVYQYALITNKEINPLNQEVLL